MPKKDVQNALKCGKVLEGSTCLLPYNHAGLCDPRSESYERWTHDAGKSKYILWDPKDGDPTRYGDGQIVSSGLMGEITADNVYLSLYAVYPADQPCIHSLAVGECIRGVQYNLSGSKGVYDIYRVE